MSDDTSITITSEILDDALVVHLAGEFDLVSKGRLSAHVASVFTRDRIARVVIEISGLEFMDSTGLNDIARLRETTSIQGAPTTVRGALPHVRRVFEITGLVDFLDD